MIASPFRFGPGRLNWRSRSVSSDVVPFLIDTPMRSGEMCNLQWGDVDGKFVTIRDRKDPKKKIGNHQRIPLLGQSPDILRSRNTLAPFPWSQNKVSDAIRAAGRSAGLAMGLLTINAICVNNDKCY